MIRLLIGFLFLFSTLQADWDQLFPQHEDATVAHHVNVISGHLGFSLMDTVIQGPTPLPITRTYSSSGALERTSSDQDLTLSALQKHAVVQGGWSFLPHLNLLIQREYSKRTCKAYLSEASGSIEYVYSHQEEDHVYILTPSKSPAQHSGAISARNNVLNYRLKIEAKNGRAVLYLPTGGSRVYEGPSVKSPTIYPTHYKLKQERLPNGHLIDYIYDKDDILERIEVNNPGGSKTYSWADVKLFRKEGPFPIRLRTSDGHEFMYGAMEYKDRHYMKGVDGAAHPKEICFYSPARKGIGARVCSLNIADHIEFVADYVKPHDDEEAETWAKKPHKKSFSADKVERIRGPVGPNGDLAQVATFKYDDGSSEDLDNLIDVTERHIKRYKNNDFGLPEAISTYYFEDGVEKLLTRSELTYSSHRQVETETVFDGHGEQRYTTRMEYNDLGCVTLKTDPFGQENIYKYDDLGKCIRKEEVGVPVVKYGYDRGGRKISETVKDRTKTVTYDTKGHVILQTDDLGNSTRSSYDPFGRCKQAELPTLCDKEGATYTPTIKYDYDIQGNLALEINARGEQLQMFYTTLGMPYRIIQPDGTEIRHIYNKNGTLAKTLQPDGTEIHFTYDILQRMTYKKVVSHTKELLSEERWDYNTFHLIRYTNPRGLTTIYTYDKAGRLIKENAQARQKSYIYDALGFLERTSDGVGTKVEIHDVMGRVTAHWTEDNTGRVENYTTYTYLKNRKDTARRRTSQGEALDQFFYDKEGRLKRHVDPLGNDSRFIYAIVENDLGQKVWTKKLIDGKNNATLETYDAAGRVVHMERFAENGQKVSDEAILYDRVGNKTKATHTVYQGTAPLKTITNTWIYNNMGKVAQEIEAEQKTTTYHYFPREGRQEKILPDGTILTSCFDGLGRPIELKSGDGSIHILYTYSQDQGRIQVHDPVHNRMVERRYNSFGEFIEENGGVTWSYDNQGRCGEFKLETVGAVHYTYDGMHLAQVERLSDEGKSLYAHRYTQFDPNGHVQEEELIGGLGRITTSHDLLERFKSQTSIWISQRIRYGPSGLVIKTKNSLFGTKRYDHDPLNQLASEGEVTYAFDSLGNPISCETNDYNQLLSGPDYTLQYDSNGNPYERTTTEGTIAYKYDALGRLTEISTEDKTVSYEYDPLSRLYSKEVTTPVQSSTFFYVYDNDREIGLIDQNGALLEFKVLGLGITGEIGATIAIELEGEVFAPLHDFRGNVIALLASDGTIAERSDFDAFGLEDKPPTSYRNPWRFSSKRTEESGLIFFGLRFYDPVLQRFLTPDPSGFADGPNLYAYTRNNPLNRLDLFGLASDDFLVPLRCEVSIEQFTALNPYDLPIVHCKYFVPAGQANGFTFCSILHSLKFSPIEIEMGKVDICNHLHEVISAQGEGINAVLLGNGITTTEKQLFGMLTSSVSKIGEGTLSFAVHNPTKGFVSDIWRLIRELYWRKETSIIRKMQQITTGLSERISSINDKAKLLVLMHSENGLIMHRGLETMPKGWKEKIDANVIFGGYALVLPLPEGFGMRAINIYSEKDALTLGFKKHWDSNATYDIRLVPCISKWHEKSAFIYDHAFLAPTGQQAISDLCEELRGYYGFYRPSTR